MDFFISLLLNESMQFFRNALQKAGLTSFNPQVWILALGRFLCEVGTGFTLFYAPIFFVNHVGLSSTSVGFALGMASISGVVGRVSGGTLSDIPAWGRRRTLLLALVIQAASSFGLAFTRDFSSLVIFNLLSGLGQGLYWPATEAVIADLTHPGNRREAYAITRLADNLGLGVGIIFGGLLIGLSGAYQALFILDGLSFLAFSGVVYLGVKEPAKIQTKEYALPIYQSWGTALGDRTLLIFVLVNILFTSYVSQTHTTLPLYFKNFVAGTPTGSGFTETTISALFACNLVLAVLFQIPVAKFLRRLSHPHALMISAITWAIGFVLIWATGSVDKLATPWAVAAMVLFALGTVTYTPSASAFITDISPPSQLGVYFSINSLCWAIGYFIGPPLGGWAMDLPAPWCHYYWLGLALSLSLSLVILHFLQRRIIQHKTTNLS